LNWLESLQAYCERTDAGFWSEPINALSNIAFLVSAFMAARLLKRSECSDREAFLLIIILGFVGVGSFIFHTFATRWAEMLDILPIASFVMCYLIFGLKRYFDLGAKPIVFCCFIFVLSLSFVIKESHLLNGSILYAPPFVALWGFVIVMIMIGAGEAADYNSYKLSIVLLGGGVFAFGVSLLFRTMDRALCAQIPIGTHFIWHLLNAFVLYLLTAALIVFRDKNAAAFMMRWLRRRPAKTPMCR